MYNLAIDLDCGSKVPLYMQIYDFIIDEIKNGNLVKNQKLPSKRKLAQNLDVSVNTVDCAYQMLVSEGYILSKPKSGFYVCDEDLYLGKKDIPTRKSYAEKPETTAYLYDATTGSTDANLFPYKIWGRLQREVLSYGDSLLDYGEGFGDSVLRNAINDYLHEYRGVKSSPEQIFVGAGSEYLLGLLACYFRGKKFVMEEPGYKKAYEIISNNGCDVALAGVDEYAIKIEDIKQSSADMVYVTPAHQYPTGASMPVANRYRLLSWAKESDEHYIIEDDYDSEFRFDRKPLNALQGLDCNDKVIYFGTFSRCLAPSIRIAYMVLPESMVEGFKEMFSSYAVTVSRMEQHTLARFIEGGHFARHLFRIRVIYRKRRDLLVNELYEKFGKDNVKISGEHTGIHLIASFNSSLSEEYICTESEKRGLRLKGIGSYERLCRNDTGKPTLVLGYGSLSENEITEVVKILKEILTLNT